MTLTEKIKLKGLELGYAAVGISPADEFTDYINTLKEREDKYDFYISGRLNPLEGASPKKHKSPVKIRHIPCMGFFKY